MLWFRARYRKEVSSYHRAETAEEAKAELARELDVPVEDLDFVSVEAFEPAQIRIYEDPARLADDLPGDLELYGWEYTAGEVVLGDKHAWEILEIGRLREDEEGNRYLIALVAKLD